MTGAVIQDHNRKAVRQQNGHRVSHELDRCHNRRDTLPLQREELLRGSHQQAEGDSSENHPVRPLDQVAGQIGRSNEAVVDAAEERCHSKKQQHAAKIPCGRESVFRPCGHPPGEKKRLRGEEEIGDGGNRFGSHGLH